VLDEVIEEEDDEWKEAEDQDAIKEKLEKAEENMYEEDEEDEAEFTVMGRHGAMISFIWGCGAVYAFLLRPQEPGAECSLREDLQEPHHLWAALLLLLLPPALGPLATGALGAALALLAPPPVQAAERRLANALTVIQLLFYSVSMVAAELLCDRLSVAAFVALKQVLPALVPVVAPLAVLAALPAVRAEAAAVYSRPAVAGQEEAMTLLQVGGGRKGKHFMT
jgi:hypothetical protein